jgi:hypothetical protein
MNLEPCRGRLTVRPGDTLLRTDAVLATGIFFRTFAVLTPALRTAVYAPPMKKDDYVTERVGRACLYTLTSPFVAPLWMCTDLKNIEHVVRKMPGPIDRSPWS